MSSIFHRLDELERVQREILVQLNGTEIPERDEDARIATHSHEMRQKVTNNDTLVERVVRAMCEERELTDTPEDDAITAILEIASAIERKGWVIPASWLRSQVEP